MAHIFLNKPSFNDDIRFHTISAILNVTHYEPKTLIIGTYNDGNNPTNSADFFYGRNYFWTIISNLANNANLLHQKRKHTNLPELHQVLELCQVFQFTFADLINDILIPLPNHDDKYLDRAIRDGQAIINVKNIIDYINNTPSITNVYATTKFGGLNNLRDCWLDIQNGVLRRNINFGCILTPSGRARGLRNFNGINRSSTIARYWLWVNHFQNPYDDFANQDGYTHLDHEWLINCGVNPTLF